MPVTETNYAANHEEVQDIIGRPPSWIVGSGSTVIACLVLLVFAGAWMIHYPDVVTASITLSSSNPPVSLVAQTSGRITQISINDGDSVKRDQVIAVIDNPANTRDMLMLDSIIQSLDTALDLGRSIIRTTLAKNLQLGEVQSQYADLFQAVSNYQFVFRNSYYTDKQSIIQNQKVHNNKIDTFIQEKEKMLNDQLKLEGWKDSVNEILVREKVISPSEYKEIQKNHLSQHIATTDNSASLLQNQVQLDEYRKGISDLVQQSKTERKNALASIRDGILKIRGQLASWKKQYVFRAPIAGKATFFNVWKANQYVSSGEQVFMIVPAQQQYEIRAQLPVYKAGKIKAGQRALIKLSEYPFEEFGMLQAKVVSLTSVALDSTYIVHLDLANGLHTTRNRVLEGRPVINGTVDFITSDRNIVQRLLQGTYGKLH